MTHAEIRTTIAWALREMDRADQRLDQSETESIPSVAKMLKEDSSVAYRNAVLILKDAVFLLGQRYWPAPDAPLPLRDKPPVKAIVIACNTATAFGLDDLRQALLAWQIDVPVVGVVEAGARGLLSTAEIGSVGVLATVGTCSRGVYPRTIASTLGLAGRSVPAVTQYGSANLAAVIEGDAAYPQSVEDQVLTDVRSLVEAHRDSSTSPTPTPLQHIMLGCTHFPLVVKEIDAAFDQLRHQPDLAPWIAPSIDYLNPAEWTARELFRELAQARLRPKDPPASNSQYPSFFLSVPSPICSTTDLTDTGALTHEYKYGRTPGHFDLEDTRVIPMTRPVGLPGEQV